MSDPLEGDDMDWEEADETLEDDPGRIRNLAEEYGPDVLAGAGAAAVGVAPEFALAYASVEAGGYAAEKAADGYQALKEKASDMYGDLAETDNDYEIPEISDDSDFAI